MSNQDSQAGRAKFGEAPGGPKHVFLLRDFPIFRWCMPETKYKVEFQAFDTSRGREHKSGVQESMKESEELRSLWEEERARTQR